MFNSTKIVLVAVMILGAASAARAAGDTDRETGGFQAQTWQDIEQARQSIQNEIRREYGLGQENVAPSKHDTRR